MAARRRRRTTSTPGNLRQRVLGAKRHACLLRNDLRDSIVYGALPKLRRHVWKRLRGQYGDEHLDLRLVRDDVYELERHDDLHERNVHAFMRDGFCEL